MTLSLPCEVAEELRREARSLFAFGGGDGFKSGERLEMAGGEASRKFDRVGKPSARFGLHFESWSWEGGHADYYARRLMEKGEPSRVDVAWDFPVPEWLTAQGVAAAWAVHLAENGITGGSSTEGDQGTYYAGARESPVRVKCYRKDLQSPAFAMLRGPGVRVELTMRKLYAKRFRLAWLVDPESAFAGAARKVHDLTGLVMQDGMAVLPQVVKPPCCDVAEEYFEFMRQNAGRIADYVAAGMDVVSDARLAQATASRMTQFRSRRRREKVVAAGARAVRDVFLMLLAGKGHAVAG